MAFTSMEKILLIILLIAFAIALESVVGKRLSKNKKSKGKNIPEEPNTTPSKKPVILDHATLEIEEEENPFQFEEETNSIEDFEIGEKVYKENTTPTEIPLEEKLKTYNKRSDDFDNQISDILKN